MDLRRFAFSTSCFNRLPLSRALSHIATAGFSSAQLRADAPHLWLDRFSPADVAALSKQLDKTGLKAAGIDATRGRGFWSDASPEPIFEPSLISSDRSLREWRIAYVKKALRLSRELGASYVTIVSGRLLNGMPPAAAQKLLEEGLLRLLEYADGLNQSLALCCEPALFIEQLGELRALLKRIDAPHLGACVDVAVAAANGENLAKAIPVLKGRIASVQLADIHDGKYSRSVPGKRDIDFRAAFRGLSSAGYSGPFVIDIGEGVEDPAELCRQSFKFAKNVK